MRQQNLLYAHSGGVTAVINASAAAVVAAARASGRVGKVFAAWRGIVGVLEEALIDTAGTLVGINAAIYSRSGGSLGIGFAIPVSLARSVMEQIIQNGSVTRGWIGVEVQAITAELAESFGMVSTEGTLISGVMRGSPAERAGVRPGDVLLAVEGRKVNDPQTMLEAIAALAPGRKAGFELRRGKEKLDLKVDIGRRPALSRGD